MQYSDNLRLTLLCFWISFLFLGMYRNFLSDPFHNLGCIFSFGTTLPARKKVKMGSHNFHVSSEFPTSLICSFVHVVCWDRVNRARNTDHAVRTFKRFLYSIVKITRLYDHQTWRTQFLRNSHLVHKGKRAFIYFFYFIHSPTHGIQIYLHSCMANSKRTLKPHCVLNVHLVWNTSRYKWLYTCLFLFFISLGLGWSVQTGQIKPGANSIKKLQV